MTTSVDTAAAVVASLACAESLGLRVEDAQVIADGYSVRVHLRPHRIVTRVVTLGVALRGDPLPWLRREVAVANHLAGSGEAVIAPWHHPGPHDAGGVWVTLWDFADVQTASPDPGEFGTALGRLHLALDSLPDELPPLAGPLTDIAAACARSDHPVLHGAADQLVPLALSWPRRPLHGDAHLGNLLSTPDGLVWTDFEDACSGPIEWDLASLTLTDETVANYPGHVDEARLAQCRDLRRLQIMASLVVGGAEDVPLFSSVRDHLAARYPGGPVGPAR